MHVYRSAIINLQRSTSRGSLLPDNEVPLLDPEVLPPPVLPIPTPVSPCRSISSENLPLFSLSLLRSGAAMLKPRDELGRDDWDLCLECTRDKGVEDDPGSLSNDSSGWKSSRSDMIYPCSCSERKLAGPLSLFLLSSTG